MKAPELKNRSASRPPLGNDCVFRGVGRVCIVAILSRSSPLQTVVQQNFNVITLYLLIIMLMTVRTLAVFY